MILLIHPPVAKPGEPPAGIARLTGALRSQGLACALLDANLEALLFLIEHAHGANDAWSKRALAHRRSNLAALRDAKLYQNPGRYQRALHELNRTLALAASVRPELSLTLANYQDQRHDPLQSADLLSAAERFEESLFFPWFRQRLPSLIEQEAPQYIGISLCYLSQALPAFALLGFLKAHYPRLRLIVGGGLLSSWMSLPGWNNPFHSLVDECVQGPGEGPLLRLLGRGDAACSSLDPIPDYNGLPLGDYLSPGLIAPYAASSGCAWRKCAFCPETAEQNSYHAITPPKALEQLTALRDKLRPSLIHLLDNAVSPNLLRALSQSPRLAPWYGFARFHPDLADVDYCRALRRSGCVMLKLGLESGSEAVLQAMCKGVSTELAAQVLAALHAAGIAAYVYLLFGSPSESLIEARQTLAFVRRHHEKIGFLNLAIFNMPLARQAIPAAPGETFSAADLSLYRDFIHPRGWSRRAVRAFLDREFKRAPAIATILRRDPPFFTSNHAAFFCPDFPWPVEEPSRIQ